jgi:probable rRNA maturation factor
MRDANLPRLDVLVSRLPDAPRGPRRSRLRSALEGVARAYGSSEDAHVDIIWAGDRQMKRLNERHTGRGDTTDVLAFAEDLMDPELGCRRLGEIVCNLDLARRSARANGNTPEAEAVLYATHGLAHLLGGDDHTPDGRLHMRRVEIDALAAAGLEVHGGEWEAAQGEGGVT